MLGMRFSPEYLESLRRTVAARSQQRLRDRSRRPQTEDADAMWSHEFAFIAGYTQEGLPFGITWDEIEGVDGGSSSMENIAAPDRAGPQIDE